MANEDTDGLERAESGSAWDDASLKALLPWPDACANKYSRGKLTLVAGSERYPGAACLATRAALRMGAGYVELLADCDAVKRLVLASCPSAVVSMRDDPAFDVGRFSEIDRSRPQAVCVGPGFSAGDAKAEGLLVDLLRKAACPVLVDGGALASLGANKARKALAKRAKRGWATVLTPHGGEAARLARAFGVSAEGPAASHKEAAPFAVELAAATGAVIVLKGHDTYISFKGDVHPMREGTPALAKAGTGDVLAGMIGALLAQGVGPVQAAVLGATLHARAGRAAEQALTALSVMPEDVIEFIPKAIRSLDGS